MTTARTDLALSAVVPAAALAALLAGAPRWASGALVVAGFAVVAERLVAVRDTPVADRLLVGVGGSVVVVVLTGVVLDVTGAALRPTTWTLASIALQAVGLVVASALPLRGRAVTVGSDGEPALADWSKGSAAGWAAVRALPWVVAASVVCGVAVHASAQSLATADAEPLQLSIERVAGTSVQIVVTASEPVGPLELRTATDGAEISYPLITLRADEISATTVALPLQGRFVVTLSYPDQTEPLRTLVLDR